VVAQAVTEAASRRTSAERRAVSIGGQYIGVGRLRGRPGAGRGARGSPRHQSMMAEPQVKPEPKAAMATFMPGRRRPSRTHSASRIGMVAAVVLP